MNHDCRNWLCESPHEPEPILIDEDGLIIECGECGFEATALPIMTQHILDTHPQYPKDEASLFAEHWLQTAKETAQQETLTQYQYLKEAHGYAE